MKKLLVLGFSFILSFLSISTKAQTIQSVTNTAPILCYGDYASINIQVNQTSPATLLKVIVGYNIFGTFVPITSTNNTTVSNINIPGLAAQNYIVRLVDSVSYYATNPDGNNPSSIYDIFSLNITQPLQLVNTATQLTSLLCNSDCDATVRVNIFGGTPPYTLSFGSSNSSIITAFDSVYSNLCAGSYGISVSDLNSCIVSNSSPSNISISEPNPIVLNGSVSSNFNGEDVSCFNALDGQITASISGGTPNYTYSLDGIVYTTSNVFSGLSAGNYTIYYKDNNGCDTSEQITITNAEDISGVISISSQVSCFSICDGELTFQVDNILSGTSPYSYSLDGGPYQTSSTFNGLCGNVSYVITIKDANGCTYTANKFLSEPTQIVFSNTLSNYNGYNISCFGLADGEITFDAPSGGLIPYSYSIDGNNFFTAMNFNGLTSGNYVIAVKDVIGCIASANVILTEPAEFLISTNIDNSVTCPGFCDVEVSVLPTNGINPILYDMTGYPIQTSLSWTGMCGDITFGTYTLTGTDNNGCISSTNITLTEPLPFLFSIDSASETCNALNGSASISITQGGTQNYAYLWDDVLSQTTPTATSLSTGTYIITVTDANGCQFSEDIFIAEADMIITFDSIPPCNNIADGEATVNPVGTPPYSILWQTGETTNTISGLNPGYYSVTVSDATGCIVTDSVEIPVSAVVSVYLDSANSMLNVLCNGYQSDTILLNTSGGTGFGTYQYYIPGVFPIPQYNNVFSGLYAGIYNVYASDANGCTDQVQVTIFEPDVIYYTASSNDVSCNAGSDGLVMIDSVSGGTSPYLYYWNTGQNTSIINGLSAGNYIVSVTDLNNCVSNPQQVSVVVGQPSQLNSITNILNHSSCSGSQTAANGEAEVSVSGGTPGYSFSWSNGINGSNISLLFPGTYIVDIIDNNGCTLSDTVIINPGNNPILDVTVQNVSCYGANDGMMITNASSGTSPYQFSADGGNTFVPFGTPFGPTAEASYFITVVDADGCTDSDSIFVNEPDELLISSLSVQNVLCYDSADGQINANVTGGTGSYNFVWNNGQTINPLTSLNPSTYNVTVTDSMGCIAVSNNQNITQPDSIYITSLSLVHVSCNGGNNGSVVPFVIGGTQSYIYSYSGGSDTNLSSGTYTATITDINGCITSKILFQNHPHCQYYLEEIQLVV